ncbi:MAG: T9SS type A sorting domain-containing protein, partial [Candidatus Eisenbacteria bacterium]|nr:T9SS type A sorting domain-containing protein [Candidatus Eisenbacteria bacterium]
NFSIFTGPSSRNNDGQDVQVRVTDINDAGGLASFDATVETTFNAVISRVLTDDTDGGDRDGNADNGETAELVCELTNIGLPSGRLYARASTGNIYLTVESDSIDYDDLGQDEVRVPQAGFTFHVDTSLAHDPYRAYFIVTLTDGVTFVQKDTLAIPIGDSLGLRDDFESGEGDWVHGDSGGVDDWHISGERGQDGPSSWRCGVAGSAEYSASQDSYLRSPVFISASGTRLGFWQWLDLENANARTAWDGAFVEVSKDNLHWERLAPEGGYPYTFDPRVGGENAGEGCFSGRARQWERVEFDLSGYSGAVWVRFRMATDGSISGEGWYVDGFAATTDDQPYSIVFGPPTVSEGRVDLTWTVEPTLSPYTGAAMSLFKADAGTVPVGEYNLYELLYDDPSASLGGRAFADTNVVPGHTYSYAVRDETSAGAVRWTLGPAVYVPHTVPASVLAACTPNPFAPSRGGMTVAVDLQEAAGGPVFRNGRVAVYDTSGRLLKVLLEGRLVSGRTTVEWDGSDFNDEGLPPGVYVVSFETAGTWSTRKVVLLR